MYNTTNVENMKYKKAFKKLSRINAHFSPKPRFRYSGHRNSSQHGRRLEAKDQEVEELIISVLELEKTQKDFYEKTIPSPVFVKPLDKTRRGE